MNFRNIIKPYPSPIITGRGVDLDFPMLAGCLALLGLGLVMITSASSEVAAVQSGNTLYMMIRHLVYLVIGLGACIVTMMIPIATWQRLGWLMLVGAFGLLVMVILPGIGREVNGSMRWIGFGAFNVQPSEIAKVFVVIYLAGYLVRRQKEVRESWMGFFKPFIVLLPMAGLLLMEPDFGATVVMMGAAAAMLFLGGVGLFRFTLMVVLAVAAVTILVQAQPYRMARLITFTDPWSDQFGSGYQLTQALIAFGRGEWLGVGLGNSVQKQFYLPEPNWSDHGSVKVIRRAIRYGCACTRMVTAATANTTIKVKRNRPTPPRNSIAAAAPIITTVAPKSGSISNRPAIGNSTMNGLKKPIQLSRTSFWRRTR